MRRPNPKTQRKLAFYCGVSLVALGIAFMSAAAYARVGGGHSYSGGHSSGGHSSGGGGYSGGGYSGGGYSSSGGDAWFVFEILRLLVNLLGLSLRYPLVGIPVDLLIGYFIWRLLRDWSSSGEYHLRGEDSDTDSENRELLVRNARISTARNRLDQLRKQLDPNLSQTLLMDFLHSLYSAVHHARGLKKLDAYSGYLSPEAIRSLQLLSPELKQLGGVVIGSAAVVEVSPVDPGQPIALTVSFEANYTETLANGIEQSWYTEESWKLSRKPGVLSREPKRIRLIACPACGAPPAASGGVCPACGNQIRSGEFDWFVQSVFTKREKKPPLLTSTVDEEGTNLPTLVDPSFPSERDRFAQENPTFSWDRFSQRVSTIFMQLQKAWTERKWEVVRPFESDSIFESHSYWIAEYKKQKLINVLRDIRIQKMVPVKIAQDRYYDAITLRIYASMIDYTTTVEGKSVSGSPASARVFTEYWTFIRGRSATPPKAGATDLNCPSCGAGLKINMAGQCEYCQAKITAGDFDSV